MAFKFLQSFLDARLFNIAEENSNYQFITATIPLFEKAIAKNKNKIISATLVALDQNIPPDDPILDEVEELLKKKWPLVRNKYTDRPTTLLRAIIIEALNNLVQENKVVANIIWLAGSNLFPFIVSNNETLILTQWLQEAGDIAEANAVADWELTDEAKSIKIPDFALGQISLKNVTFGKEALKQGLNDAVMNGQPLSQNSNQHYNNSIGNLRQEWATEFSTRASELFFTTFSNAFNSLTASLNAMNIDKPINDFFTAFKDDLAKTLTGTLKSSEKLRLRSQILWWKEALYSSSLKKSYRDMDAIEMAISMAADLNAGTPAVYPVSIDYILKETALSSLGTDKADRSITALLTELSVSNVQLHGFHELPDTGRISFGAFIAGCCIKKYEPENFETRTGISATSTISYGQLSMLIFHDLQALQINLKA